MSPNEGLTVVGMRRLLDVSCGYKHAGGRYGNR
jgi:hypothetical protein